MSDGTILTVAQFIAATFGLDVLTTTLAVQCGLAGGSLGGAVWGTWQGGRIGWRSLWWMGAATVAACHAFQVRRELNRRVRLRLQEVRDKEARLMAEEAGYVGSGTSSVQLEAEAARHRIPPQGGSSSAPPRNRPPTDHAIDIADAGLVLAVEKVDVPAAAQDLAARHNRHAAVARK